MPELHDAYAFSLCDAVDGYLQVKLDDQFHSGWLIQVTPRAISTTLSPDKFQRGHSDALSCLGGVMRVADDDLSYGKRETAK